MVTHGPNVNNIRSLIQVKFSNFFYFRNFFFFKIFFFKIQPTWGQRSSSTFLPLVFVDFIDTVDSCFSVGPVFHCWEMIFCDSFSAFRPKIHNWHNCYDFNWQRRWRRRWSRWAQWGRRKQWRQKESTLLVRMSSSNWAESASVGWCNSSVHFF